jgi:hypothetical protein
MTEECYNIVAFTSDWKYKGIVDPSLRNNVKWIAVSSALDFIRFNKPKDEHWLIEIEEY